MSSTRLWRRCELRSMMSRKRSAALGSSMAPLRRVSVADRTAAIGVRSSWEAFATKSSAAPGDDVVFLRDVHEHEEDAVVVARERRGMHEDAARLEAGQVDLDRHVRHLVGGLLGVDEQVESLGVEHGFHQELAHRVGPEQEHRLQGRVHEDDASLLIEHDDALASRRGSCRAGRWRTSARRPRAPARPRGGRGSVRAR